MSKNKVKILLAAAVILLAFTVMLEYIPGLQFPFVKGGEDAADGLTPDRLASEATQEPAQTPAPTPTPEPTPEPIPTYTYRTIAVAGDIVCHSGLNTSALNTATGEYNYLDVFSEAAPYLKDADIATICLETTFNDSGIYTGYPQFQSPKQLALGLADIGIDFVSTASNHCADTYYKGLTGTLDVLDEYGLAHAGTYRTLEEREKNHGITVVDADGVSVAFLAFTYGTNCIRIDDYAYGANVFCTDYMTDMREINYDLLDEAMAAAREAGTDFIAVYMHWGEEYASTPSEQQTMLADYLIKRGAGLVIGGHPHVPQPMEYRTVTADDGTEKKGYVIYCVGNFISSQNDPGTDISVIANITLRKNDITGETAVTDSSYTPMYMLDREDQGISTGAKERFRLLDMHKAIDEYEAGDTSYINSNLYTSMTGGLQKLHDMYGKESDSYYFKGRD